MTHIQVTIFKNTSFTLTDGIFETGAYGVPSKSQIPTILGQDGSSSTQCSHASWACHWRQRHAQLEFEHWVLDEPP